MISYLQTDMTLKREAENKIIFVPYYDVRSNDCFQDDVT